MPTGEIEAGDTVECPAGIGQGVVERVEGNGAWVKAPSSTRLGQSWFQVLVKDLVLVSKHATFSGDRR